MLTCKVGEKIINTIEYDDSDIRKWSNKGILKCPVCDSKMIYKHGEIKIAHFAHEKNTDCLEMYSETETEEHLKGKKIIYEWLKTQENIKNLKLEAWIPETRQRPDIYFEMDNKKYVIEFQCTPIATEYLERHRLYELAGIRDIWILGINKYNLTIDDNSIYHLKRIKEIEKYSNYYLDINKNSVIMKDKVIYNYFEYKILELQNYYIYSINDVKIDNDKKQISPSNDILKQFTIEYDKKYIEYKNKIELEEKRKHEEEIQKEKVQTMKKEVASLSKDMIINLNERYKIVNQDCKFELDDRDSRYYLGKIKFSSKICDYTFFIKSNCVDCCVLEPCTKVDYLGGRGKHGGLRRRYYSSYEYCNVCSKNYEKLDAQIIKDFICDNVSKELRKYKYKN